jgi:hypothetical protein
VDDEDGDEGCVTYYYSYQGKALRSAPHKRAMKAFERERGEE